MLKKDMKSALKRNTAPGSNSDNIRCVLRFSFIKKGNIPIGVIDQILFFQQSAMVVSIFGRNNNNDNNQIPQCYGTRSRLLG